MIGRGGVLTLSHDLYLRQLRIVADEALVDIGDFSTGAAKDTDALAATGEIRVALDCHETAVSKALDNSHMSFPLPRTDHKEHAGP